MVKTIVTVRTCLFGFWFSTFNSRIFVFFRITKLEEQLSAKAEAEEKLEEQRKVSCFIAWSNCVHNVPVE